MIVVVGGINMDLTVSVREIPRLGETVVGGGLLENGGGKGANQAIAAARLGGDVKMIGAVGTDRYAEILLENLRGNGVDISYVARVPGESGLAIIEVDARGQNSIVVVPGGNGALTVEQIRKAEDAIKSADYLAAQLEIPYETVVEAFRIAKKQNCRTILNPSPVRTLTDELLRNTDVIVPNEHELRRITGMPTRTAAECKAACARLRERGVDAVVLTRGRAGALYMDAAGSAVYPAFRVKATDATAAGDSFLGGFLSRLDEGGDIEDAIERGQRVAAFSIQRRGAQRSFPMRSDIIR